jgi:SpoVK/Ycf46/Vps4 family AAA+-type ATPase
MLDGGIICLEDLDTLFESCQVTLSGFLNILDGMKPNYGILTIATTNKPERIDAALVQRPSRFDRKWVIGDPDEACRRRLLRLHFRDKIDNMLVEELTEKTEGWSAAYIKELYITSAFKALRESSSVISPEHVHRAYEFLDSQRALEKRNFNPAAKSVGFGG